MACCFVGRAFSWSIGIPEGKRVLLEFLKFELENHSLCRSDHLTVFAGEDLPIGEELRERQCGPSFVLSHTMGHSQSPNHSNMNMGRIHINRNFWDWIVIQGVFPLHARSPLSRSGCGGSRVYYGNNGCEYEYTLDETVYHGTQISFQLW